tara:strand:- start:218 stop:385 length:168 start_codon:yes stop_codon:yes gene_type:complete
VAYGVLTNYINKLEKKMKGETRAVLTIAGLGLMFLVVPWVAVILLVILIALQIGN